MEEKESAREKKILLENLAKAEEGKSLFVFTDFGLIKGKMELDPGGKVAGEIVRLDDVTIYPYHLSIQKVATPLFFLDINNIQGFSAGVSGAKLEKVDKLD